MKLTLTSKGKKYDYDLKSILRALVSILTCMAVGEQITIEKVEEK